jgi:hypothetical protein
VIAIESQHMMYLDGIEDSPLIIRQHLVSVTLDRTQADTSSEARLQHKPTRQSTGEQTVTDNR